MSCTGNGAQDIGDFSTGIWISFGQPYEISPLTISGWVCQKTTLGALNAYIGTCYSGAVYGTGSPYNSYVCPDLDDGSFAILESMYRETYYQQLMRSVGGAGGVQPVVQALSEGDSKIQWVNASELAKTYSAAWKQAIDNRRILIRNYIKNSLGGNIARSVNYYTIDNGYYNGVDFNQFIFWR
jgi:hypothetical protein